MAWWLLYEELYGDMEKEYPIMSKNENDVVILGGESSDTISLKSSEDATADYITFTGMNSAVAAADTVPLTVNFSLLIYSFFLLCIPNFLAVTFNTTALFFSNPVNLIVGA